MSMENLSKNKTPCIWILNLNVQVSAIPPPAPVRRPDSVRAAGTVPLQPWPAQPRGLQPGPGAGHICQPGYSLKRTLCKEWSNNFKLREGSFQALITRCWTLVTPSKVQGPALVRRGERPGGERTGSAEEGSWSRPSTTARPRSPGWGRASCSVWRSRPHPDQWCPDQQLLLTPRPWAWGHLAFRTPLHRPQLQLSLPTRS